MALQYTVVSAVSPAAAGGTTTVPLGFVGKAAVVFGTRTPGTQGLASAFRVGVDDGTTRFGKAINPGLFGASHFADGWMSDAHSIVAMRTQGLNELMVLGHVTFVGTDMVVSWDAIIAATGVRFYFFVVGGVNAKVIGLQPNTSPFSTTAIGFPPTALMGIFLADTFNNVLLPSPNSMSVGFSGSIECGQCTVAGGLGSNFGNSIDWGYLQNGEWITVINPTTGTIQRRNIVTSLDPLGFTITNTGGGTYAVLALDGCTFNTGVFTQPNTTVPLLAGAPRAAFIFTNGKPASAVAVTDYAISFGAGDAVTQKSVWTGELNGDAPGVERANSVEEENFIGLLHTPTGNFASTLNTQLLLTGLASQQMSLAWPTDSGVANQWGYGILADDLGTGPCGEPVVNQCIPDPPSVPGSATSPTPFSPSAVTPGSGVIVQ